MLEDLKSEVCEANQHLVAEGLVVQTWGNVSGADRAGGHMVIKPSGVPYDDLTPDKMVVVSLADGEVVEGKWKPSSDAPTHLELYRAFDEIGGVAHSHSLHATAWAQARKDLPALGTTHADYFHGPVPCTRLMTEEEISGEYERNTGLVIVECFGKLNYQDRPGVLVADHGPFTWGPTPAKAVENAAVLDFLAHLAIMTRHVDPYPRRRQRGLLDKHYIRKHGPSAYYGQDTATGSGECRGASGE